MFATSTDDPTVFPRRERSFRQHLVENYSFAVVLKTWQRRNVCAVGVPRLLCPVVFARGLNSEGSYLNQSC